jgi:DNA-binding MarR family transcriptional regulator
MTDLSILSRYSRTFFERRLADNNIGFTEHQIIMYLCKSDTVNQDTIAKHFMLDKGAVAKALSKLESKEIIQRTDNPNNKREKLISITPSGQSQIEYLTKELQEWHDVLFQGLSSEEINQFGRIISKMSSNAVNVINNKNTLPCEENHE